MMTQSAKKRDICAEQSQEICIKTSLHTDKTGGANYNIKEDGFSLKLKLLFVSNKLKQTMG